MNNDKKLTRKSFFKLGGLLLAAPLVTSFIAGCDSSVTTPNGTSQEEIDRAIRNAPKYSVPYDAQTGKISQTVTSIIPNDCIFSYHSSKIDYDAVVKVTQVGTVNTLQVVYISVVEQLGTNAKVSGSINGNDLLLSPGSTLRSLNSIDHDGLTKRFSE